MRDLIELVGLLHKTKLKNNDVMKAIIEPGSKMETLFDALLEKTIESDEDAKALFPGKSGVNITSLKNKLLCHASKNQ